MLKRALAVREKRYGPDHEYTVNALYNLASLYADMGRYEAAEPLLGRAVEAGDRVFGTDDRRARLMHDRLRDVRRHTPASPAARPGK
jgi:tetratricopeptide (TPR) repeat protein